MARPLQITAFEHDVLRVGDSSEAQLSSSEALSLSTLAGLRPGFCIRGHHSVRLAQYAGLVNLGGRVLEILPKVGAVADRGACLGTLLRLLRLANKVPLFSRGGAGHGVADGGLLDVFIAAFLDACLHLVRAGLLQRYRAQEADIGVVRGRLLLERQVSTLAMRPDRLACRYDELGIDIPHNRILKAAMLAVRQWVQSLDSHRKWLELNAALDDVSLDTDPLRQLARLTEDRQAAHYTVALRWAGLILRLLSPNVRGGTHLAPEMLFDMNRLFETAVANVLHTRATAKGLAIGVQQTGYHLGTFRGHPYFRLRPDLVVRRGDEVLSVADTKWTEVKTDSSGRIVPTDAHVYQLNAYAAVYPCSDFALIYPWHSGLGGAIPTSYELGAGDDVPKRLQIVCLDVGADGLPAMSVPSGAELQVLLG